MKSPTFHEVGSHSGYTSEQDAFQTEKRNTSMIEYDTLNKRGCKRFIVSSRILFKILYNDKVEKMMIVLHLGRII